jgi:CheY-like chemotaxis protein
MEPARPDPSTARGPRAPLKGVRILLVEDDPDTSELVHTMLAGAGAIVMAVASAAAAREALEGRGFDVVVTDYALGQGMTGFELLTFIRSQPVDGRVPVIGYSAHGGLVPPQEQEAFTAYAAKPQFLDNLLGLVRGVSAPPGPVVDDFN